MYTPKFHAPLLKPVSRDGNLKTTTAREENVHDLASTGNQLPTQSPANVILINIEEDNLYSESLQAELLRWHCYLGHCLFTRLMLLSALRIPPRKILKVKPPKCAGCLYRAMAKHLYHTKYVNNRGSIWEAPPPGECISVHHMDSSTPGFISQLRGKPIKQR